MLSAVQVLCWTGARELIFAALFPCSVLSRARSAPRDPQQKVLLGQAALVGVTTSVREAHLDNILMSEIV